MENTATPPDNVAVPITVPPFRNCTVPVAADGVTVAVNVTVSPGVDELGLADKAVVEFALFTVSVLALDVLPL